MEGEQQRALLLGIGTWLPSVLEEVRKELKNEHLKQDFVFQKKFFHGKTAQRLEKGELIAGYQEALQTSEYGEAIAAFVIHRWILRHADVYQFFLEQLSQINPEFTEIHALTDAQADPLMEGAVALFGARASYIFAHFNGVAFTPEQKAKLEAWAEKERAAQVVAEEPKPFSVEQMQVAHEAEMAKMEERYEKRLQGVVKKYSVEVEGLKKQVAILQRKLTSS